MPSGLAVSAKAEMPVQKLASESAPKPLLVVRVTSIGCLENKSHAELQLARSAETRS